MKEERPEFEKRWETWMAAAQDGDTEAYDALLRELLPFTRSAVGAMLRGDPASEDTVQDVLLSIHAARHTWRRERPLLPWLRAVTRNAVIDHVRRRERALARHAGQDVDGVADEDADPARELVSPSLRRVLGRLPESQREAVVMLKIHGLSIREAARQLGVSESAVKLRAHRGYGRLRDLLGRPRA